MTKKEFDVGYWEDAWKNVRIPAERKAKGIHEIHHILKKILPAGKLKLIEIGCAPGSWLAYFHNCFHYSISGIEYAPKAYEKTVENLKILNIPGAIHQANFFEFDHEPYDVVFSTGFIEHFENVAPVIQKIVNLCAFNGGYVVTIIPSMQGINWWISKTFRPQVAAGHFPIKREELIKYHEQCGLETRYCNYIGSFHILTPIEKNKFSKDHPLVSAILNVPFRAWNRIVNILTRTMGLYPKFSYLTNSIIYIGCGSIAARVNSCNIR
jgi:cyclopropane fatty-acyl-phospholipid synthase-like methyltransferase